MPEVEEQESAAAEVEQAETAAVSETAQQETEEEKKQGGVQHRIDKLTREKREAQRATREMSDRLEKVEKLLEKLTPTEQAKADAADPKPDPATWTGTNEEFTEALSRWAARQEHKQLSEKDQKAAETAEQEERDREVITQFQERISDFAEEHDDYNDVVGSIKMEQKVGAAVQVAITEDENGPALAYYLGQHPDVCKAMSDMSPARAVAKLGRIAERLFPETTASEEEETVEAEETGEVETSAPKPKPAVSTPIKPIKKTSSTATGLRDDLSPEEWARRFRKQMKY